MVHVKRGWVVTPHCRVSVCSRDARRMIDACESTHAQIINTERMSALFDIGRTAVGVERERSGHADAV